MIGSAGDMSVFWSNSLVGSITTLGLVLLFWPLLSAAVERMRGAPKRA
jgi:TctA family transporter